MCLMPLYVDFFSVGCGRLLLKSVSHLLLVQGGMSRAKEQGSRQASINFHFWHHINCFAVKTVVVLMAVLSIFFLSNVHNWC